MTIYLPCPLSPVGRGWGEGFRKQLVKFSSADRLIVQKAFAGRDQDWVDIRNVIDRQTDTLAPALILQEIEPLLELKDDHEGRARLRSLLRADE